MKILVATSDVPFVEGGHRVIARALAQALRESGHESEILTTPQNRFGRQFSAYAATRFTDVEFTGNGERIDRLISLRFPSYVLKHPNHVCWLNHRMREYYDLWPDWAGKLGWKGRLKENVRRRLIQSADRHYLKGNLRKLYAQSKNIQEGLLRWGNIPSEVLYPPPPQREYRTEGYGDFILSPARLTPLKRIPLLIEGLAKTRAGKAVLVGDGPELAKVRDLIRQNSLESRVEIQGHLPESALADLYARCRAVYYAPVHEDYGLVPIEAFRSRKPVLTATDSGGATELVQHERSGYVLPPDADAFGRHISLLFDSPDLAEQMGAGGFEDSQKINWPDTVVRLLS
ncbi:MAG TPA: glycosyltransferase family 4 protein [Acidobacteriota bacterium]|nr:glycosyltransferase family 4 protein [Acidobacteriota bacterium]